MSGEQLALKKIAIVEHKAIYLTQPPDESNLLFVVNQKDFEPSDIGPEGESFDLELIRDN